MSLKLIERRLDKLETDRYRGLILRWADTVEGAAIVETEAQAENPSATVIVIRWLS